METKTLDTLRAAIDDLDMQIVSLLARRFDVVRQVGALKMREGLNVVQPGRIEAVKNRVAALGGPQGLDEALLRAIYTLIIDHAHVVEQAMMENAESKEDAP